ncbi:MAG: ribosome silencing factor [Rhodoferax sp.]|nr:ribosome silencing factor [Rhodoferax sp.]
MTTSTTVKKDTQKLQRAIVDALEDVKAQEIQVFDTELLSALFERVIIASGTSNRQTKALAASVRDAVRSAGFPKPRVEGEANGEWIIVDCGQAVVHIMQPTFRQYYRLEELWGDKPVRIKLGATKPPVAPRVPPTKVTAAKSEPGLKRSNAAKKGVAEAFPSKAQLKLAAVAAAAAEKTPVKKVAVKKAVAGQSDATAREAVAPATKARASRAVAAKTSVAKDSKVSDIAAKNVLVKATAKATAKSSAKSAPKSITKRASTTPVKKSATRKTS